MKLVSYAQNLEDVVLLRAFSDVEHGFYVDIGAQDPTIDSVSRAFHERGWKGVHVEASAHYAELLRQQRPGDTVVHAAVADSDAVVPFYEIANEGISTIDSDIAAQHRARGFDVVEKRVASISLSSVLDACESEVIHWLKLDIEGAEKRALQSWGGNARRPVVVVVESTVPLSQVQSHREWDHLLRERGYSHAYFDGLNRFYVAQGADEIARRLGAPPNVFDGYVLSGTASANVHRDIEERIGIAVAEARSQLTATEQALRGEVVARDERLAAAHQETSDARLAASAAEGKLVEHAATLSAARSSWMTRMAEQGSAHEQQIAALQTHIVELADDIRLRADRWEVERERLASVAQSERDRATSADTTVVALIRQIDDMRQRLSAADGSLRAAEATLQRARDQADASAREGALRLQSLEQRHAADLARVEDRLQERRLYASAAMAQLDQTRQVLAALRHSWLARVVAMLTGISALDVIGDRQVVRAEYFLTLEDNLFVSETYRLILRRAPDPLGEANYRGLLASGADRAAILADIAASPEARSLGVEIAGLERALRRRRWRRLLRARIDLRSRSQPIVASSGPVVVQSGPAVTEQPQQPADNQTPELTMTTNAQSVDDVLALRDSSFVRAAYRLVLLRDVDTEGLAFYTDRVRQGVDKLLVLNELAESAEASERNAVYRAEILRRAQSARRTPSLAERVVGRLMAHGAKTLATQLRAIDNSQHQQLERLDRMDATLNALSEMQRLQESALDRLELAVRQVASRPGATPRAQLAPVIPRRPTRKILYYVDHTITCPTNTGMQRVTRRLAAALLEAGEDVLFVKWNPARAQLAPISREELAHLSKWHGPVVGGAGLGMYAGEDTGARDLADDLAANSWLLVPEVTHITPQAQDMTTTLVLEARRLGVKTAFVFYDATPLRRLELEAMSRPHAAYMQELLLADLILPISLAARADLCGFLRHDVGATRGSGPLVETIGLPAESHVRPRSSSSQASATSAPYVLSVGSIVPHKNQMLLVEAFERYCDEHPGTTWRLKLIGNVHPDLLPGLHAAMTRHPAIEHLGHVSDEDLAAAYDGCAFTVFPSVMEGFGLPILESLWFAKPCVCADFGAMREVAEGGGCLMIDTRSANHLAHAISGLIGDPDRLAALTAEASLRRLPTWSEYTATLSAKLSEASNPVRSLGDVYYFVDHTAKYEGNTGIQRVTRGLARALLEQGARLIPVRWSSETSALVPIGSEERRHLEKWNGPDSSLWRPWKPLDQSGPGDWLLVPELTHLQSAELRAYAGRYDVPCAWVFYDAIPWKMTDIYPPHVSQLHATYMREIGTAQKVLSISDFSRHDLQHFLSAQDMRCGDLERHVVACELPGEFLQSPRISQVGYRRPGRPLRLLCVGTVEPRKNHLGMLEAFQTARRNGASLELTIAGGSPFEQLGAEVQAKVDALPGVRWLRRVDDIEMQKLYTSCDATIYPSLEEGFGLPILESLWNARPCICARFGAMAEVAEGGGCLTVDVRDPQAMADAIARLAGDPALVEELSIQAIERDVRTWRDYARDVAAELVGESPAIRPIGEGGPCLSADEVAHAFANLAPRPLLSVCISTYNRAGWLAVTLRNMIRLLPPSNVDIELLVCDNASTDDTPGVVQPYIGTPGFTYVRNPVNVGMLGNLRVTAHASKGRYVWILGDDDLLMDGTVARVLKVIRERPDLALVYLNYAFTRVDQPGEVGDLDAFIGEATPITEASDDHVGTVREMCARSENFFTAIYCLVFRRDHALRAYSQDTSGRPFSTMLTCIPTTYHVLHHMMDEKACWLGQPAVVVNMNVSWLRYASLWILERMPEAFDFAESRGGDASAIDRWRAKYMPSVVHFFHEIFTSDPEHNAAFVSIPRLVNRLKHLPEFRAAVPALVAVYVASHRAGNPLARRAPADVFGPLYSPSLEQA